MSIKTIGLILLIVGVIGLLVCALADVIGIGHDPDAYGSRQTTGTFASAVVFVIGVVLYLRRKPSSQPAGD